MLENRISDVGIKDKNTRLERLSKIPLLINLNVKFHDELTIYSIHT